MRETAAKRGYGSRWRKARATYLGEHPTCAECAKAGQVTAATVVDHRVPHRGDLTLFWDSSNWQSLCKPCHNSHKQRLEKSGRIVGCDESGLPIDPNHHWRRGGAG